MPRRERECIKGAKEEEEWGSWRAPKPNLARANSRVGVPSWRANFDLASKKLASTQKTHILHHNNKATQPKPVKYQ